MKTCHLEGVIMSDLISVLPTFNPLALFIALNGLNTLSTLRIFTTDMVSFLKTKDIQHLTCLISVNKDIQHVTYSIHYYYYFNNVFFFALFQIKIFS